MIQGNRSGEDTMANAGFARYHFMRIADDLHAGAVLRRRIVTERIPRCSSGNPAMEMAAH